MNQPWYDPMLYSWIPGTVFGVSVGGWGTLLGVCAPRGKAKGLVMGVWALLMLASVVMLAAAIVALVQKQPYGVWYGLMLPGAMGVFMLGAFYFLARHRYRQAEAQRIAGQDL